MYRSRWHYFVLVLILPLLVSACAEVEGLVYNAGKYIVKVPNITMTNLDETILPMIVDVLPGDIEGRSLFYTLSPNGEILVATVEFSEPIGLSGQTTVACILHLENDESSCYPYPADTVLPRDTFVVWSPDSSKIAFQFGLARGGVRVELDLWVLDVDSGRFSNLTDDGIDNEMARSDDIDEDFPVDYAPAWSGNDLYFVRKLSTSDERALYRLTDAAGDPELVAELDFLGDNISFITSPAQLVIFPDGTQAAFAPYPYALEGDQSLLNFVDLQTGETRVVLAKSDFLMPGEDPDEFRMSGSITNLLWNADGSRLYIRIEGGPTYGSNYLMVEPQTGVLNGVLPQVYLNSRPDPDEFLGISPLYGVLSRDGEKFYLWHLDPDHNEYLSISMAPADLGATVPLEIMNYTSTAGRYQGRSNSNDLATFMMSEHGRVVLGNTLFEFSE